MSISDLITYEGLLPIVNFINVLRGQFLYKKLVPKIQRQKVSRKKLLKDFCTKKAHLKH